jgi:nicotinate phosphoribosyltransferase
MNIYDKRDLSLLVDFYELTMTNGYFQKGLQDKRAVFEMFYRNNPDQSGFVIIAGLAQVIEYIQGLTFSEEAIAYLKTKNIFSKKFLEFLKTYRFTGDIYAVPEGTIVYPNTPIVTVEANLIDAQLIETMLLLTINHQSLIATKTNRIVRAAKDRTIMEFGARRAHGYDAAIYGARAAYIGGAHASATTLAEPMFGVPAVGTMAHSWVQYFENEYKAFKAYAEIYPDQCALLVDTYDVLKSGVPNAIRIAKEVLEPQQKRLKSVRLDSGDLAYLSKATRKMLDANDMQDCQIIVSNSVDEYLIRSLDEQGAKIDVYGVGERLITSSSSPVFGGVYKIVAMQENGVYVPRIKISENIEKVTNPGYKKLYRAYDQNHKAMGDILALYDETLKDNQMIEVHPMLTPYLTSYVYPETIKELQVPIFKNGELVYDVPTLLETRTYVQEQLQSEIWEEEQRFENPHLHYVNLTSKAYALKIDMYNALKNK